MYRISRYIYIYILTIWIWKSRYLLYLLLLGTKISQQVPGNSAGALLWHGDRLSLQKAKLVTSKQGEKMVTYLAGIVLNIYIHVYLYIFIYIQYIYLSSAMVDTKNPSQHCFEKYVHAVWFIKSRFLLSCFGDDSKSMQFLEPSTFFVFSLHMQGSEVRVPYLVHMPSNLPLLFLWIRDGPQPQGFAHPL